MRVHQPGGHLMRERGAEVSDWSWGSTRRRLGTLWRLTRPYRGAHRPVGDLAADGDRDRARSRRSSRSTRSTTRLSGDDGAQLYLVVGVFLAAGLANWGMTYVETYLTGWVGERILADLRITLFRHLQRLSLGFYERTRAGVIISRLTNDVEAIDQLVTDGVTTLVQSTLTLIGTAIILFILDWRLALATLSVIPLMSVGTVFFRKRSARAYANVRERLGLVTATLAEDIAGMRDGAGVHARGRGQRELPGRDARLPRVEHADRPPERALLPVRRPALVGRARGRARLRRPPLLLGTLSLGTLFAFMLYVNNFFDPVQQLSQLYNTFLSATAALDKIIGVLDEEPEVVDRPARAGSPHIEGRVHFDDVRFAYGRGAEVLHGIDLDVPAGTTVALVGHTGAGKSTIAKLLARFYDPTDGRITIDGTDLRDVTQASLRHQLGIVPQEGFLFAGTVHDNIAFGRPDATREQVVAAARAVGAHDFVARLENGYDTRAPGARHAALARPAPARRVRPRAARRPADPDPRRGDLLGRHRHRAEDRAGPAPPARRPHRVRDRAPALDDPRRRPDRRARARPGRRAGLARRAAAARRALHVALRRLGRRRRVGYRVISIRCRSVGWFSRKT